MATRWAAAASCCPSPPGLHFWLRLELPPERVSAQDGETNGKPQHLHFYYRIVPCPWVEALQWHPRATGAAQSLVVSREERVNQACISFPKAENKLQGCSAGACRELNKRSSDGGTPSCATSSRDNATRDLRFGAESPCLGSVLALMCLQGRCQRVSRCALGKATLPPEPSSPPLRRQPAVKPSSVRGWTAPPRHVKKLL